jgi:hypothetical protein
MITSQNTASVSTSGIKSAVSFGIKDSGLAHIFNVLRNQLYTDKIGAVVREYSANAYDANVEAGNSNTPIVVSLPSALNKVFKIRDFGRGLSEQDIQDIYCFYGESTKRQSNAFIGQLGLGSKSAFAYGDNFVINSFTDGVVRSYNAFIDPSGIGQIALLSSSDTSEPNGVEIVIPVKMEDAPYFAKSVKQYLRFFKVKPTIVGMDKGELEQMTADPISSGDGWAYHQNVNVPHAVMGNIAYPIAGHSMKLNLSDPKDKAISTILNTSMVINFEIGDLDVAASREGLQYTPHTLKNLRDKISVIADKIVSEIQQQINGKANSLYAAKRMLSEMDNMVGGFYHLRSLFTNLSYKGIKLTNDYVSVRTRSTDKTLKFRVMRYQKNWNGNINASETEEFQARPDHVLIFNDLGNYNSGARHSRYYAETNDKKVFMFTPQIVKIVGKDEKYGTIKATDRSYDKQIAEIKKLNGFCDDDFILASSIVIPANAVTGSATKTARTGVLLFKPDDANSWRSRNAWEEAKADLKDGSGVYVRVNNYKFVPIESNREPSCLSSLLSSFKGLIDSKKVVGVTQSQIKKMGDGWVSLKDLAIEKFNEFVQTNNLDLTSAIANTLAAPQIRNIGGICEINQPKHQNTLLAGIKDNGMKQVLKSVFDSINSQNRSQTGKVATALAMMDQLDVFEVKKADLDPNFGKTQNIANGITQLYKKLVEAKPMLTLLDTRYYRWNLNDNTIKTLVDYLNS